MKLSLKKSVLIIIMVLVCIQTASADLLLKYKKHVDGYTMMGREIKEQDIITSMRIADGKLRFDAEDVQSFIVRLDNKTGYLLNHENKTFMEIPLNFSALLGDTIKSQMKDGEENEAAMAFAAKMLSGGAKLKISVTATDEKKKINKWNCEKFLQKISMPMMGGQESVIEMWTTEDIKIDPELYKQFITATFSSAGMQNFLGADTFKELSKLRGINVKSISTAAIMGTPVKTTEELIETSETDFPDNIFSTPSNYRKTNMMSEE